MTKKTGLVIVVKSVKKDGIGCSGCCNQRVAKMIVLQVVVNEVKLNMSCSAML